MNAKDLYFLAIPLVVVISLLIFVWARRQAPPKRAFSAKVKLAQEEELRLVFNELMTLRGKLAERLLKLRISAGRCQARLPRMRRHQPDHKHLAIWQEMLEELSRQVSELEGLSGQLKSEMDSLLVPANDYPSPESWLSAARDLQSTWSERLLPLLSEGDEKSLEQRERIADLVRMFEGWLSEGSRQAESLASALAALERVNPQNCTMPRLRAELVQRNSEVDSLRSELAEVTGKRELLDLRLGTKIGVEPSRLMLTQILAQCEGMYKRHKQMFSTV